MTWDFDDAFAEHHGRLLATTARKVGDLQTAADIVAETFARAWKRRSTYDPARGTVGAWLNCIRRSAIADHFRAKRETLPLVAEPAAPAAPADKEGLDLVEAAIGKLPGPWSEAVRVVFLEDRSFPDAAKILGCSVGTAHRRALLGIQRLRRMLLAA